MTTNNAVNNGLSGQSGTGNFVGSNSPTLANPALGTPASGNLTNCTGLSISGISGLGTGIGTALGLPANGTGEIPLASGNSWTPTITFATPGDLSVVYSIQTGTYFIIGNLIWVDFILSATPTFTTASGALRIAGLPNAAIHMGWGACLFQASTFPTGTTTIALQTQAAQTYMQVIANGSGVATANFTTTQCTSGATLNIQGSVTYLLA